MSADAMTYEEALKLSKPDPLAVAVIADLLEGENEDDEPVLLDEQVRTEKEAQLAALLE